MITNEFFTAAAYILGWKPKSDLSWPLTAYEEVFHFAEWLGLDITTELSDLVAKMSTSTPFTYQSHTLEEERQNRLELDAITESNIFTGQLDEDLAAIGELLR